MLGNAPAGKKNFFPEPSDTTFEFAQRSHETLRVAGQLRRRAICVILAGARQAELHERHQGGREDEKRHDMPRNIDRARENKR